jgi:hypothetical protein
VRVVTKWWVNDPHFGRFSVYVPVGETPRDALTVALAQRGYQVVDWQDCAGPAGTVAR